jgi:hypothetical protein
MEDDETPESPVKCPNCDEIAWFAVGRTFDGQKRIMQCQVCDYMEVEQ